MSPAAAGGALRRVLEVAIDGYSRVPGARTVAAKHLQKHGGSVDDAIDSVIVHHVRLAGAQGFLTNIGGVAALPVAIPANLAGDRRRPGADGGRAGPPARLRRRRPARPHRPGDVPARR